MSELNAAGDSEVILRWLPWPGWTGLTKETAEWLVGHFPAHRGHLLSREATVDMGLRFWCRDCQKELAVAIFELAESANYRAPSFGEGPLVPSVLSQREELAPWLLSAYGELPAAEYKSPRTPMATLGMLCRMDMQTGVVAQADLRRFATIMNWLLQHGLVRASFGDPTAVKLAVQRGEFHRGMLVWVVSASKGMDELNELLGASLFVQEGALPTDLPVDWEPPDVHVGG